MTSSPSIPVSPDVDDLVAKKRLEDLRRLAGELQGAWPAEIDGLHAALEAPGTDHRELFQELDRKLEAALADVGEDFQMRQRLTWMRESLFDEYWWEVDEDDRSVGPVARWDKRLAGGRITRSSIILPVTRRGTVILQRRAPHLFSYPSQLAFPGGHNRYLQDYLDTALHEGQDELPFIHVRAERLERLTFPAARPADVFKERVGAKKENTAIYRQVVEDKEADGAHRHNAEVLRPVWDRIYAGLGGREEVLRVITGSDKEAGAALRDRIQRRLEELVGKERMNELEVEEFVEVPLEEALALYRSGKERFAPGFHLLLDPKTNEAADAEHYSGVIRAGLSPRIGVTGGGGYLGSYLFDNAHPVHLYPHEQKVSYDRAEV